MSRGISIEGMSEEWRRREGKKSNKLIRARMTMQMGDPDFAMQMYAEVAAEEEQIRDYCRSLGLMDKSYINAVSAASCWATAGDMFRALQQYDALIADPTLTPRKRNRVCELAEELREQRRQWAMLRQQQYIEAEQNRAVSAPTAETAAA